MCVSVRTLMMVVGGWWKAAGLRAFEQVIGKGFVASKEGLWEEKAVRPSGKSTGKKSYDLALNPGPTV